VRVTYQDADFVDYAIAANDTVQISLAGGHKPGTDQIITVTGQGGAVLIGQESIIGTGILPNPALPGQNGKRLLHKAQITER